jgi:hypothetical protein
MAQLAAYSQRESQRHSKHLTIRAGRLASCPKANEKEPTMRNQIILTLALVLAIITVGCTTVQTNPKTSDNVTLKINYGTEKPARTIQVPFEKGQTALEILQRAATTETHPVGEYVFVTAIDGIKGERGVMAWYYKVNGSSTGKLAISNVIEEPCSITWLYEKDRCSATVDL